ncbi:hypothetical protein NHF46_10085 [Arthrobacter alpinus]|nr:hypothetical protein [Arthrobacter alpinus]
MKKLTAGIALATVLVLTGCGGEATSPTATTNSKAVEVAASPADLTGAWKQENPNSEDSYQQATITADTITIDWVSDGGNTTSIYWVGSFQAPTQATEPYVWTSQRDAEATDAALLASTDDTKEFTFQNDVISYKVSAFGTTITANLKKK